MSSFFGFNTESGEIAFAAYHQDEVVCYIPQYGGWYETRHNVKQGLDELAVARDCVLENMVRVVGEGARMVLKPGEYHPRVWRGVYRRAIIGGCDQLNPLRVYGQTYMRSIVAAESLFSEVKEVFKVVEPELVNFNCFGHRFRELLMLLCSEVEACWTGILKANEMEVRAKARFTTKNYVMLCSPLKLAEWQVRLKDYRGLTFQPFKTWDSIKPTSSLSWYDDYNKVKHDREGNFSLGTLGNVLQAAAALHIMQSVQFGPGVFDMMLGNRFSIFDSLDGPTFDLSEIYISDPVENGDFHTEIKLNIE
ncbi:hypothetical protein ACI77J_14695 [Pseudomonas sp. O64]|uniref:hypothetical protein n=1 Tax=unclassified Pseudomonas TaxID=196821 RepID=UPI00387AF787